MRRSHADLFNNLCTVRAPEAPTRTPWEIRLTILDFQGEKAKISQKGVQKGGGTTRGSHRFTPAPAQPPTDPPTKTTTPPTSPRPEGTTGGLVTQV